MSSGDWCVSAWTGVIRRRRVYVDGRARVSDDADGRSCDVSADACG